MTYARAKFLHHNNPYTWLVLGFLVLATAPAIMFPYLWLDLRSVTIYDAPESGDPLLTFETRIRRDFLGTYSVVVREADTDRFVCQGTPDAPIPYVHNDEYQEIHRTLSWWLGGSEALDRCHAQGMDEGAYYTITCHSVIMSYGVSAATRCVRSNDFLLIDED